MQCSRWRPGATRGEPLALEYGREIEKGPCALPEAMLLPASRNGIGPMYTDLAGDSSAQLVEAVDTQPPPQKCKSRRPSAHIVSNFTKVRFAADSALEQRGFELLVPHATMSL
jgi:hypothetical protein